MANALQPSSALKDKTNVFPVGIRTQEATAEDFGELGEILIDHALKIDAIVNADSTNPYYGRFESLALLQATHTVGEVNAWAVIDAGPGITPQIAIWDNVGQEWEISGASSNMLFFANYAAFPAPGQEDKFYITLDKNELYFWKNNTYNKISGSSTSTSSLSNKIELIATQDNQTTFNIPSRPNGIDLWFNDGMLTETYVYNYDTATGDITLINGFFINTGQTLNGRTYGDTFQKQIIEATTDGQTVFPYSGAPANIDIYINDAMLTEGKAYNKTNYTNGNEAVLIEGIPNGSSVQINKF